ncbi:short-chain fatty acyl-CoA regulator family protein [Loktanella sp. SALINAS62]|uniref:short-chain fatty acyl-CoA regulator family protein n=1 Tax=Loktanella sp. SALINAS62 TaxID=2706124 RepID=UPI001B8C5D45|nr:short-chain fatty acyl-CoA regulator family protein [Loktanella sp. SALINAS62]MBS1303769.1 DUF2083 domain-containing protein [Loktanella sp. SALINAS62]
MNRTGERIRARRMDAGLAQRDLARAVDISASYLNLIEHGKRPAGAALLRRIAATLAVDIGLLERPADPTLVDRLRAASDRLSTIATETVQTEDLVARFPGWAGLITAQALEIRTLEDRLQMMTDRLTYDPDLAKALHGVISAVTAIQSTAAILTGDSKIDADWQARFHSNIHSDARKLADTSRALVAYLDAPDDAERTLLSPLEDREAILATTGFHRPHLETHPAPAPAPVTRPAVAALVTQYDARYADDAQALPLDDFLQAARAADHDPMVLASQTRQPLDRIFRRLASVPPTSHDPDHGLMEIDAAGAVLLLKQVFGFDLTRGGDCPLWPIYTALGQPGRPITAAVVLPGQNAAHLVCHAIAVPVAHPHGPHLPPLVCATMLVRTINAPSGPQTIPVGVACRICARSDCPARREPAMPVLAVGNVASL